MKPKNYIKAKSKPDGKFVDGTFEEVKDFLSVIWNPEMYVVELPDQTVIDGDDFIEQYHTLSDQYLETDNGNSGISLN